MRVDVVLNIIVFAQSIVIVAVVFSVLSDCYSLVFTLLSVIKDSYE